jgi:hypothetical protein
VAEEEVGLRGIGVLREVTADEGFGVGGLASLEKRISVRKDGIGRGGLRSRGWRGLKGFDGLAGESCADQKKTEARSKE